MVRRNNGNPWNQCAGQDWHPLCLSAVRTQRWLPNPATNAEHSLRLMIMGACTGGPTILVEPDADNA